MHQVVSPSLHVRPVIIFPALFNLESVIRRHSIFKLFFLHTIFCFIVVLRPSFTAFAEQTEPTIISDSDLSSLVNRPDATIRYGDVMISRGEQARGPLVVVDGTLFISGTVDGDLIVINGSVSLQRDAVVTGNLTVTEGHIYASRHARVSGEQIRVPNRYVLTGDTPGQLTLKRDQPGPVAFKVKPGGWRFTRVRGHDFALSVGLEPTKSPWYPEISGIVYVPTMSTPHGFLDFKAGIELPLIETNSLRLGVTGYKITDTADRWHIPANLNSLAAFVTRNDFFNYYLKRGLTVHAGQQLSERSTLTLSYIRDRYFSLSNQSPFTLFGGNRAFRGNPAIDAGKIHSFELRYGLNTVKKNKGWYFDGLIEHSAKALGSDFSYTRYDFTARRSHAWNKHQLDIRAKIAGSDNPLPLQRTYVLGAINGLRGFGDFEFAGDRLFIANVDYRLPLHTFRARALIKWYLHLLTFFDTGTAYFNPTTGRNNPAHPLLLERVNPHAGLPLAFGYTDLRSNAGAGLSLSSHILKITLTVAQNLHTTSAKPRVLIFLHRDLF